MSRYLNSFTAILTSIMLVVYVITAIRLHDDLAARIILALPFFFVWLIPVVYWMGQREGKNWFDKLLHIASYLSMGFISFLITFLIIRELLFFIAYVTDSSQALLLLREYGTLAIYGFSILTMLIGLLVARRGPSVKEVTIPIDDLGPDLEGLRIVQISDLHIGLTVNRSFVERVARMTNALKPDIIAITGDLVDGSVEELAPHIAPLAELQPQGMKFLALGNHDYYSGVTPWISHFESLGIKVLQNEHIIIKHRSTGILIGGVIDPAVQLTASEHNPDPWAAMGRATTNHRSQLTVAKAPLRILLAHNPQVARAARVAGFDLQLSGHTHAGQFIPWTVVARLVHRRHFAGLSREGTMWVYVNAGTGSWGPPIRFGTSPELTLIRLTRK